MSRDEHRPGQRRQCQGLRCSLGQGEGGVLFAKAARGIPPIRNAIDTAAREGLRDRRSQGALS
eukprot:6152632-Pleurochrysis_carterae.AAC.1